MSSESMNPANLRWKYLLESVQDDSNDMEIRRQINLCLETLKKFPLVIPEVIHCNLLQHFSKEIVSLMEAKLNQLEQAEKSFKNESQEISPIVSKKTGASQHNYDSPNSSFSEPEPKRSKSYELLDDNPNLDNDDSDGVVVSQRYDEMESRKRKQQEEEDLKMALRLSQEISGDEDLHLSDQNSQENQDRSERESSPLVYHVISPERTQIKPNSYAITPPPLPAVNYDDLKITSESEDDDDPFEIRPKKKERKPKQTNKKPLPKATTVTDIPRKLSSDNESTNFESVFNQDPIFSSLENLDRGRPNGKVPKPKKTRAKTCPATSSRSQDDSQMSLGRFSTPDRSNENESTQSDTSYCPKVGTGGYAILLALYYEGQDPYYKGYMGKQEVCEKAQKYTETCLTHGKAGAAGPQSWYSGWNSSGTLIKKDLIKTSSNPLKIELTEKGQALASRLAHVRDQAAEIHSQNINEASSAVFSDASWLNEVSLPLEQTNQFKFCYVTSTGKETDDQDLADLGVHFGEVSYLVKCRKTDLEKSGKMYKLVAPSTEENSQVCFAYLAESHCLKEECVSSLNLVTSHQPKSNEKVKNLTSKPRKTSTETQPRKEKKSEPDEVQSIHQSPENEEFHMENLPSAWTISETPSLRPRQRDPSGGFTLKSGQYEIVLVVDAMEVTGGSHGGKAGRKVLTLQELDALEVNYESRKLSIGDFVWIAKERAAVSPRELVLPYVVERKRIDDLRSSIMDGRYKEQKTRLNLSGIKVKFYLVEEASLSGFQGGHNGPRALDRNTLDQAISNTCIRDGFRIRLSKTQRDSCRFLANFTDTLREKYSGRDLTSSSLEAVGKVADWETTLLPFKDFYEHSRPDKAQSVREIFSNMLICQKGVSHGMAWAITEKYSTPVNLKQAFDRCNPADRDKLLFGLAYDSGKKKIPLAVSKIIAVMFTEINLK